MAFRYPGLCEHKASGNAYVTDPATGKPLYLRRPNSNKPAKYGPGPGPSPEAQEAYDAWLAGYMARAEAARVGPVAPGLTVTMLADAFLEHAERKYVKHGRPTSEARHLRTVAGLLREMFGTTPAASFRASCLRAVVQALVAKGYCRETVNAHRTRVVRMFRWGLGQDGAVPDAVVRELEQVEFLEKGYTEAPEYTRVAAVPYESVRAVLDVLAGQRRHRRRVLVEVHWLTGCRPGEAVIMRPCDLDRSGELWVYRPYTHKTEHRKGRAGRKEVLLGRQAQALLGPLLAEGGAADRWLFPAKGRGRAKGWRGHLSEKAYAKMVATACRRAGVAVWTPNQVRHSFLTRAYRHLGLDSARSAAGHATVGMTLNYVDGELPLSADERAALRDRDLAARVARELG